MAWLTLDQQKDAVAEVLGLASGAALPAPWVPVVTRAGATAQNSMLAVYLGRGYTAQQAADAMLTPEIQEAVTVYYALLWGQAMHTIPIEAVARFNRLKELQTMAVLDATGTPEVPGGIAPAGTMVGVGHGKLNAGTAATKAW